VIHGKGIGTLREIVHAALRRRSDVVSYELASDGSGWGATVVILAPGS
jgi:dsDNA-specific endonuclease/ATPase MutS2